MCQMKSFFEVVVGDKVKRMGKVWEVIEVKDREATYGGFQRSYVKTSGKRSVQLRDIETGITFRMEGEYANPFELA